MLLVSNIKNQTQIIRERKKDIVLVSLLYLRNKYA